MAILPKNLLVSLEILLLFHMIKGRLDRYSAPVLYQFRVYLKDFESKDSESKDFESKDFESKDSKSKDSELKDSKSKDSKSKDYKLKDFE